MNTFNLEMFTPKKMFFSGEVESLIFESSNGKLGILPGHHPMVASLSSGEISLKTGGEWKKAFAAEGFVEVRKNEVLIFAHHCEWPEDIDEARAKAEMERRTEQLRNAESLLEHKSAEIQLQRISAMLSVKKKSVF